MFGKRKERSQYKRLIAKNNVLREKIDDLVETLVINERDKKALEKELFKYKLKCGEVKDDKPRKVRRTRPPLR